MTTLLLDNSTLMRTSRGSVANEVAPSTLDYHDGVPLKTLFGQSRGCVNDCLLKNTSSLVAELAEAEKNWSWEAICRTSGAEEVRRRLLDEQKVHGESCRHCV